MRMISLKDPATRLQRSPARNMQRGACIETLEPRVFLSAVTGKDGVQIPIIAPVAASLSGGMIASAIAGQKTNIHQRLILTNFNTVAVSDSVTPSLFLSTGTTIDSSAIALTSLPARAISLKPGHHVAIPLVVKTTPASVPAGAYHLLVQVSDTTGITEQAASASTVNIVPPQIDLSGSFITLPQRPVEGVATSFLVKIVNNGNVPVVGALQVQVGVSPTATFTPTIPIIATVNTHANLKPHRSMQVRVNSTPDANGTFYLVADIDPSNVFQDVNRDNNIFFSPVTVTVTAA